MTNQFTQTTVPSTSNVNNDINQQHFQESPQYQNSPQYLDSPQYQNTFQYESPQYPVAPNYEHEVQPTVQVATVQPVQTNLAADDQNAMMFFILGFVICWFWFIAWSRYKNSSSPAAKKFSKMSMICFLIFLITDAIN